MGGYSPGSPGAGEAGRCDARAECYSREVSEQAPVGTSQRRRCWRTDLKGEEDFVRCKRILGARKELPGREMACAKARDCEGTQLLEGMAEFGVVEHQVRGVH